jgi:hypothetical protein
LVWNDERASTGQAVARQKRHQLDTERVLLVGASE